VAISIREVAAQAGVSRTTVSQVLNNNAQARITDETRERVRRVAQETGYRPNLLARSLGRRRTDTLGLMISGLRNPFFVSLLEAAEAVALEAGYQVLADTAPASALGSYSEHGRLRGWPVDGVLMWGFPHQVASNYLGPQSQDIPVVYLGYTRRDGTCAVAFDLHGGGRQAAEHLVTQGYRRITYLYPYRAGLQEPANPSAEPADLRYQAYREVCRDAGLEPRTILMPREEETRAAGLEAGLRLAALAPSERPDAVLCFNDVIAVGVYHGLRRAGLSVPGDMAVIGFDGIEEGRFLDKPLTTVVSPADVLCREAFGLLAPLLRGEQAGEARPAEARQVLVPTALFRGETA
jgi:DNA-binding LacI/PurR family transcriptional regulator